MELKFVWPWKINLWSLINRSLIANKSIFRRASRPTGTFYSSLRYTHNLIPITVIFSFVKLRNFRFLSRGLYNNILRSFENILFNLEQKWNMIAQGGRVNIWLIWRFWVKVKIFDRGRYIFVPFRFLKFSVSFLFVFGLLTFFSFAIILFFFIIPFRLRVKNVKTGSFNKKTWLNLSLDDPMKTPKFEGFWHSLQIAPKSIRTNTIFTITFFS
jgi:hypothetical protein